LKKTKDEGSAAAAAASGTATTVSNKSHTLTHKREAGEKKNE